MAQGDQVSTYRKPVLIQLAKAVTFVDLPTDLASTASSLIDVCKEASCFKLDKKFWSHSRWHHCPMTSPGSLERWFSYLQSLINHRIPLGSPSWCTLFCSAIKRVIGDDFPDKNFIMFFGTVMLLNTIENLR